jgi:hypothetical protein
MGYGVWLGAGAGTPLSGDLSHISSRAVLSSFMPFGSLCACVSLCVCYRLDIRFGGLLGISSGCECDIEYECYTGLYKRRVR